MSKLPESSLEWTSVEWDDDMWPLETVRIRARVNDEDTESGVRELLRELRRVAALGFSESEIRTARQELVASVERPRESEGVATSLERRFVSNNPWLDPRETRALLDEATRALTNAVLAEAQTTLFGGQRTIFVTGPRTTHAVTTADLRSMESEIATWKPTTFVAMEGRGEIAIDRPAGSVSSTREIPEVGVTEWTLGNGMRVVMKPIPGSSLVELEAFAAGGQRLASDAEISSTRFAASIADAMGLGSLSEKERRKWKVGPYVRISTNTSGLTGLSKMADLEKRRKSRTHLSVIQQTRTG